VIPVIAGSWGDLAVILGLSAATLVALKLAGTALRSPRLRGRPPSRCCGGWWRRGAADRPPGTPGMVAAGISFAGAVRPARLPGCC